MSHALIHTVAPSDFHKPLAKALSRHHEWDRLSYESYLTSTPREDLVADFYFNRRFRKETKVVPKSVHIHALKWELVPGFTDVYAVGAGIEVFFRFRCPGVCDKGRVITACGRYGVEVRYT